MGLFNWNSHCSNNKTSNKDFGHSLKESGNVFLMLFGAVGMVGVIGASTMTVMKGPVKTMSEVTKRTLAENNMIAAGKLALIAAVQQNGGDCDTDGVIEPIPMSATSISGFAGGSEIPTQIGTSKEDSWGMPFGYCAWDHGISNCGANHLAGGASATQDEYVLAIVSAGPDGVFNTSCNAFIDSDSNNEPDIALVQKAGGSDDLFMGYTYNEAAVASGGLWNLEDPDTAEISKDVSIKDSGGTEQFAFDANAGTLSVGTSGEFPSIRTDNLQAISGSINLLSNVNALTADGAITGTGLAAGSGAITGGSLNVGSGAIQTTGTLNAGASTLGATGVSSLNAGSGAIQTTGTLSAGASTLGATGVSSLSAGGLISTTADLEVGGEVGIGLSSPSFALHIEGNSTANPYTDSTAFIQNTSNSGASFLSIKSGDSSGYLGAYGSTSSVDVSLRDRVVLGANSDSQGIVFYQGSAGNAVYFDRGGNVGIGIQNPTSTLTVNGEVDVLNNKIINLATPTVAADAATKQYVDDRVAAGTGFSETDPEVGTLDAGKWCIANAGGTAIDCTVDPTADTLGTHIATQDLDMDSNDIININMLEFDAIAGGAPTAGAADNLGDHTATTNLDMANRHINNLGQIRGGSWSSTYDTWIQGGANGTTGGARNLAILGTDEDSGDTLYVNYNNEYSGGTRIGGTVTLLNHTPTAATHAATKAYVDAAVSGGGGDNLGAGGTTTGSLFSTNASRTIGRDTNDFIRFDDNAQAFWQINGQWEYQFFPSNFSPYVNADKSLGLSSKRWTAGWFSGAVTAGSFSGNGANITAINGDNITDGTIDSSEIQDNTLTANDLAPNSVGVSEIATDAVGASEIAANAVGASEIANGSVVATTKLSATGTKNASTFLRGDNTWAVPAGGAGCSGGREHMEIYVVVPNCGIDGVSSNGVGQCQNGTNRTIVGGICNPRNAR